MNKIFKTININGENLINVPVDVEILIQLGLTRNEAEALVFRKSNAEIINSGSANVDPDYSVSNQSASQ